LSHSVPPAVLKRISIDGAKLLEKVDATVLAGYRKAGFKLNSGPDGSGALFQALQSGGSYHLDVGNSSLYADAKIKVKQGQTISRITARGVVFADGSELPADKIVFATGYTSGQNSTRALFGSRIADQVKGFWGLDEEGEIRSAWRPSGCPGFWIIGGNFAMSRYYSRLIALQIKALEENLWSLW
jgi:hypothetical protein